MKYLLPILALIILSSCDDSGSEPTSDIATEQTTIEKFISKLDSNQFEVNLNLNLKSCNLNISYTGQTAIVEGKTSETGSTDKAFQLNQIFTKKNLYPTGKDSCILKTGGTWLVLFEKNDSLFLNFSYYNSYNNKTGGKVYYTETSNSERVELYFNKVVLDEDMNFEGNLSDINQLNYSNNSGYYTRTSGASGGTYTNISANKDHLDQFKFNIVIN